MRNVSKPLWCKRAKVQANWPSILTSLYTARRASLNAETHFPLCIVQKCEKCWEFIPALWNAQRVIAFREDGLKEGEELLEV